MAERGITGWVTDIVDSVGEVGVGALIALENLFPPIPSEAILPLAGFQAQRGDLNWFLTWVAATIGALVGALVLYAVGALFSYQRLHALAGKSWFFLVGQKDLERGQTFFARHGARVVLFGRFIPLVRSVVSIPAGLARMPLGQFVAFTMIGSAIWNAVFIALGWVLGDNWDRVESVVGPIGYLVALILAAGLAYLVVRNLRRRRALSRVL